MYARVATFEGADRGEMQRNVEAIRERSESGPPEGVPATGFLLLTGLEGAKAVAIGLFETEADLRKGDEVLNSMDPPTPGGLGSRRSVEMFEVAVQRSA